MGFIGASEDMHAVSDGYVRRTHSLVTGEAPRLAPTISRDVSAASSPLPPGHGVGAFPPPPPARHPVLSADGMSSTVVPTLRHTVAVSRVVSADLSAEEDSDVADDAAM